MAELFTVQSLIALLTLTALEVVLGVDNIIFISILAGRLPHGKRERARVIGLALAMITRIGLLLCLTWIMTLTRPLFRIVGEELSGRDLILLAGGLFLLAKSTSEIHHNLEIPEKEKKKVSRAETFPAVVIQIAVLDIIFSLDSVITAVGLVKQVPIMVAAIVIAVGVMILSVNFLCAFVDRNPTIKMLALSFLLLIGVSLVAEGLDFHIPKGYIYFAMAFSVGVETLNMKVRARVAGSPDADDERSPS
ncbi:MAG: TerC family protein [Candidatus Aminicenantes bacterium]|nr:TerC family protein [Candidatus Aminicenantes bacterium]